MAKVGALVSVLVPALLLAHVGAAMAGTAILRVRGIATLPQGSATAVGPLAGSVVLLTAVGLLGLALGLMLRNTGGSVAAALGLFIGLPGLVALVSSTTAQWLPSYLGDVLTAVGPTPGGPSALAALLALTAWVIAVLVAAAAVLKARDA